MHQAEFNAKEARLPSIFDYENSRPGVPLAAITSSDINLDDVITIMSVWYNHIDIGTDLITSHHIDLGI